MGKEITFKKREEIPLVTSSYGDMAWNKTGDWRYLRPIFQDKTAPCNNACPAGEDIVSYLYLVEKEKYKDAWNLIKEENPFPGVCGRACMHPCETMCNRSEFDESVYISSIERFLADHAAQRGYKISFVKKKKKERVAIIGSGPAGLTCAYHLLRMGYNVTVFESLPVLGGMLRIGIPDYRLPKEILEHEINSILELGAHIQTNTTVNREMFLKDLKDFQAVFIATGSHKSVSLGIPGQDYSGVHSGLSFLKDIHLGKKVIMGKKVAIIGGGNTAIDAARSALRMGAKPFIIYRRTEAEMPAIRSEIIEAEKEGIEISHLTTPIKISAENGKVTGLECVKNRTGDPDNRGRRVPVEIKGSQFFAEADMVITAVGEIPDLSFAPKGIKLQNQRIATNESLETGRKGVFAGGDVTFPLRSIAHAIGAGKKASIAIDRYFQKSSLEDIINKIQIGDGASLSMRSYLQEHDPSKRRSLEVVRFKDINLAYFEHMSRQELDTPSIEERISSVKEVRSGFSKETALKEVRRCFNCGLCNLCENCYLFCPDLAVMKQNKGRPNIIDYDHCKGCGICAEECPRDAVYMEREEG